jgi:regulator of sigma E protease
MSFALLSLVSFIIVLSFMVLVHELGHFLVAKACGVKVETFSIGFPPRLFGFKYRGTDYCISALPFGGYVKMAGETPGSGSGEADEFTAQPRWQRVLIAAAGPVANFILAFALMTGLYMMHNEVPVYLASPAVLDFVPAHSAAARAGLEAGDRVVCFGADASPTWDMIEERAALDANSTVPITVQRSADGQTKQFSTEIYLPAPGKGQPPDLEILGLLPKQQDGPVVIQDLTPGDPAAKAGLRPGDGIVSINGHTVHSVDSIVALLNDNGNRVANLVVARDGHDLNLSVQPVWSDNYGGRAGYILGFAAAPPPFRVEQLPLTQAAGHSIQFNVRSSSLILDVLHRLFTPHAGAVMQQLSGPIGIARMTGEAAEMPGWQPMIQLSAIISLNLGIMNLLPIPILDGGTILLLAIEGALRRDINQNVKERVYQVAFVMLIIVFAFIMVNDVSRLSLFSKFKP